MTIQSAIEMKLSTAMSLQHIEIINESNMHNVPANSETHFKLVLVSTEFEGKRQVPRHQLIYKILHEELEGPVHALALHTYTLDEWNQNNGSSPLSPPCLGGSNTA